MISQAGYQRFHLHGAMDIPVSLPVTPSGPFCLQSLAVQGYEALYGEAVSN